MSGATQIIRPIVIRHVENEVPTGAIDGINTTYSTQFKFISDSVCLYMNGLRLRPGIGNDFVITGNQTFNMNYPPLVGDDIIVDYLRQIAN